MLERNRPTARRLGRGEIWLLSIGRLLAAFGLGVLAMRNYPHVIGPLGFPAAVLGVVLVLFAGRGRFRAHEPDDSGPAG